MTRAWEPREQRLVAEYLMESYPGAIHLTRVRLGSLEPDGGSEGLDESDRQTLSPFRRWADAIVITETDMILIEGKITPDPGVISQIEVYSMLIDKTPELKEYMDHRLVLELVFAVEDPVVSELARAKGIRVQVYRPPWVDSFLAELTARRRTPTQRRGI